MLLIVKKF